VRVYFEDTDFSGRVYHGAYVRFLERGRTEFLRAAGLDHRTLAAADPPLFFTLRRLELEFRAAAAIDDLLSVTAAPLGEGRASFLMRQTVLRGGEILVEARAELCLIDAAGRPRRPPAAVRAALAPQGQRGGSI
jgi:acyl-CoA thioester hydrolase